MWDIESFKMQVADVTVNYVALTKNIQVPIIPKYNFIIH